jgi:type II secretory pathway component GspD/PulD (secretin)
LDQPGLSIAGQVRLIPLEHANAGTLASSLNVLFTQRYAAMRDANAQRNRPIILPDPRMNALLVSAGVEDNKALDELLQKLDQKLADPALVIEVIGLKENDASRIATMIQTVFAGRLQAMTIPGQTVNPQDRVVVSADALSNAIIVVANKENLETIRGLVAKVDVEPQPHQPGVISARHDRRSRRGATRSRSHGHRCRYPQQHTDRFRQPGKPRGHSRSDRAD